MVALSPIAQSKGEILFWFVLKQLALSDLLQVAAHLFLLGLSWWWWHQAPFLSTAWKFRRFIFFGLLIFVVAYQGDTIWSAYQKASEYVKDACNIMSYTYNKVACENVRPSP